MEKKFYYPYLINELTRKLQKSKVTKSTNETDLLRKSYSKQNLAIVLSTNLQKSRSNRNGRLFNIAADYLRLAQKVDKNNFGTRHTSSVRSSAGACQDLPGSCGGDAHGEIAAGQTREASRVIDFIDLYRRRLHFERLRLPLTALELIYMDEFAHRLNTRIPNATPSTAPPQGEAAVESQQGYAMSTQTSAILPQLHSEHIDSLDTLRAMRQSQAGKCDSFSMPQLDERCDRYDSQDMQQISGDSERFCPDSDRRLWSDYADGQPASIKINADKHRCYQERMHSGGSNRPLPNMNHHMQPPSTSEIHAGERAYHPECHMSRQTNYHGGGYDTCGYKHQSYPSNCHCHMPTDYGCCSNRSFGGYQQLLPKPPDPEFGYAAQDRLSWERCSGRLGKLWPTQCSQQWQANAAEPMPHPHKLVAERYEVNKAMTNMAGGEGENKRFLRDSRNYNWRAMASEPQPGEAMEAQPAANKCYRARLANQCHGQAAPEEDPAAALYRRKLQSEQRDFEQLQRSQRRWQVATEERTAQTGRTRSLSAGGVQGRGSPRCSCCSAAGSSNYAFNQSHCYAAAPPTGCGYLSRNYSGQSKYGMDDYHHERSNCCCQPHQRLFGAPPLMHSYACGMNPPQPHGSCPRSVQFENRLYQQAESEPQLEPEAAQTRRRSTQTKKTHRPMLEELCVRGTAPRSTLPANRKEVKSNDTLLNSERPIYDLHSVNSTYDLPSSLKMNNGEDRGKPAQRAAKAQVGQSKKDLINVQRPKATTVSRRFNCVWPQAAQDHASGHEPASRDQRRAVGPRGRAAPLQMPARRSRPAIRPLSPRASARVRELPASQVQLVDSIQTLLEPLHLRQKAKAARRHSDAPCKSKERRDIGGQDGSSSSSRSSRSSRSSPTSDDRDRDIDNLDDTGNDNGREIEEQDGGNDATVAQYSDEDSDENSRAANTQCSFEAPFNLAPARLEQLLSAVPRKSCLKKLQSEQNIRASAAPQRAVDKDYDADSDTPLDGMEFPVASKAAKHSGRLRQSTSLRPSNTLFEVWLRSGEADEELNRPRARLCGGLYTDMKKLKFLPIDVMHAGCAGNAILSSQGPCNLMERAGYFAQEFGKQTHEQRLESIELRMSQLRKLQHVTSMNYNRDLLKSGSLECHRLDAQELQTARYACPMGKSKCEMILNEDLLSHFIGTHLWEPGMELSEIYSRERMLIMFDPSAFDLGKNVCVSMMAYGGFRSQPETLPIKRFMPVCNTQLPDAYSRYRGHLPLFVMVCRSRLSAIKHKRVRFKEQEKRLHHKSAKDEDVLAIWIVSMDLPQSIHVLMTIFNMRLDVTRSAIMKVRGLSKIHNANVFMRHCSHYMRLSEQDLRLLTNAYKEPLYMELSVCEYGWNFPMPTPTPQAATSNNSCM